MKFTRRSLHGIPSVVFVLFAVLAATAVVSLWPASRATVYATETTKVTAQMLNAQTALNASSNMGAAYMPQCRETVVYIQWSSGAAAGAVTIESAHDVNYAGTWAPLAVVAWTAASKEDIVQITGIHLNLRTRISSAVTSGTVNTWMGCN